LTVERNWKVKYLIGLMVWIWIEYIFLCEVIICLMCCNDCQLLCISYDQGFSILLCHTINAPCVSVSTFPYHVSIIACFPVCVCLCSYMIICTHECGPAHVLCGVLAFSLYSNISYHEIKLHLMCFIMECKVCGHNFRYRLGVIWQHCCWQQDVFSQLLTFTVWKTLCIPIIWAWRILSTKIWHCGGW
jgi:hypothetical protein